VKIIRFVNKSINKHTFTYLIVVILHNLIIEVHIPYTKLLTTAYCTFQFYV